jgi:hypothetical protein
VKVFSCYIGQKLERMKRRSFFEKMTLLTLFSGLFSREAKAISTAMKQFDLKDGEIQHMVIFNLPYPEGSPEATKFLKDGTRILSGIPVVRDFQAFKQVSPKNDYQYGFSMVFTSQADYSTYNEHPDHVTFVQDRWMKEVSDFLEIDFKKPY